MNANSRLLDEGTSLRAAVVFAVIVLFGYGFLYEMAGTVLAHLAFPRRAEGSLIERDGRIVGSAFVAQPFSDARYFHPRPSASGYDPMSAAGSNLARSNPELHRRIDVRRADAARREGISARVVPGDLVTESGSGLDPDLSPVAARVQIARVARARGLGIDAVARLVAGHTARRPAGVLGAPRVNVLELNLALDALPGPPK